jgi:hypothetical protein
MTDAPRLEPAEVRARLAFDVARLRDAARRLEAVDRDLLALRAGLERRARELAGEGTSPVVPELGGTGQAQLRYAQAQATAELARRAALGEVLRHGHRLALVASMAVGRWLAALGELGRAPQPDAVVKGHIDAGRLAHRILASLRPGDRLLSGCGQLTSAAVVADLVHPANAAFVLEQLEEGLYRGRHARGVGSDLEVVAASSRALRAAARLLTAVEAQAGPAAASLAVQAEGLEARVAAALGRGRG